jgi:hypothetical protein
MAAIPATVTGIAPSPSVYLESPVPVQSATR